MTARKLQGRIYIEYKLPMTISLVLPKLHQYTILERGHVMEEEASGIDDV